MTASGNTLCFTQLIEFDVAPLRQQALAHALAARSERMAFEHAGLVGVSVQASDDGSRVLQYLQWQSRAAWEAAIASFDQEPFLDLLQEYQARGVNFAAFQTLSSLARTAEGDLLCQVAAQQAL